MSATTIRSGTSSGVMWGGALIVVLGMFTALYSLALIVQGSVLPAVIVVLCGLVVIAAGVALFLLARRACARLDPQRISWSTMWGACRTVTWEQVHRVHVPGAGEPWTGVVLQLTDGSVVPDTPLRRTQSVESAAPHPWYLRAGDAVVRAHQDWYARHTTPRR